MGLIDSPMSISLKVSVIARLEFELTYNNVTVNPVSHYYTDTPHCNI